MDINALLFTFCGGEPFLNDSFLTFDKPELTSCFLDTFPTWVSCGFLWISSLPFLLYSYQRRQDPLPYSLLHLIKTGLCMILACLAQLHFTLRQTHGSHCSDQDGVTMAAQVAMLIKIATFLLTAALMQAQKRWGKTRSGVMFFFWFIVIVAEVFQLYTYITDKVQCAVHALFYAYFATLCLQFFAHCWVMPGNALPANKDTVSLFLAFMLIYSVIRNKFSRATMWNQALELQSTVVGERLDRAWNQFKSHRNRTRNVNGKKKITVPEKTPLLTKEEKQSVHLEYKVQRKDALLLVTLKEFWFEILEFLFYSWFGIALFFMLPVLLRYMIDYIDNKDTNSRPLWVGVALTLLLFVSMQACSTLYHCNIHYTNAIGQKMKAALMYIIYKKALTVSKSENKISVGEVVNLMSVDCQRIQDSTTMIYYIPNSVLFLAIACYMLVDIVGGLATLGGMLLMLATIPLNMYIAYLQSQLQKEILYLKGLRVRLMNEILSGIKVLKMYAWEFAFIQKIQEIRDKEVKKVKTNALLIAISTSISNNTQFMIHFVLITIHVFTVSNHYLSSSVAFVSFSIINVLKAMVAMMPTVISRAVQAYVSMARIQEFLCCSDLDEFVAVSVKKSDYSIRVEHGVFTWDLADKQPCVSGINLKLKPGQLIAVVGHCGSGKSSLISALLGEMRKLNGSVEIKGSVAYVPQEAWLQNMTLRDNILFGREYNSSRYWKTVENCALKSDLAMLEGGDKAEIGEKGTNISGGQKQRISLARAVYSNADVYFLDDPLSAVDSHVGKDLFKNVIGHTGQLKNKTRILVTHAIHWLPLVDNIVVMNNGVLSEFGTYDELMTHNGPFAQFLLQYLTNEPAEDLNDPEIQWIRENILEQVESVTSDGGGGASSDSQFRLRNKRHKKKKFRTRRQMSSMSMSQSVAKTTSTHVNLTQYDVKRLTTEETVGEGSVKMSVYKDYVKAMGVFAAVASQTVIALYYALNVFSMFWLTFWTEDAYLKNQTNSINAEYAELSNNYLIWYAVMGIVQVCMMFFSFHLSLAKLIQASSFLHSKMLMSVMKSPMSFFDTVPKGRILNRFSSDIDIMDNKIPDTYCMYVTMLMSTISSLVVMVASTPIFFAILIPTLGLCFILMKLYLPTVRKTRRIESVTRSPIYNHFSETLTGSTVIRAYQSKDRFIEKATQTLDDNSKYYFAANTGTRWLGSRLDLLANLIVLAITLIVVTTDALNGGQLGLSVNYAVQIGYTLNNVVWSIQEMEMNIVSVERVNEYTDLKPEADWLVGKYDPRDDWPTKGQIEFKRYTTRYREGLELVLKGITIYINHGEKVGVVGRTGAGKSSMTLALFRLIEAAGGEILIDGVNIADLGLHKLRSKFTILPQDPVLFTGSLRMNVDPLNKSDDDDIWRALESAHLKKFALSQPEQLDYDCGEAGQNLSVGQRQLVCLARTLLNKTKILILDEATAAVDMETDTLIQQTIRSSFHDCTILTIAHRLNTVVDYNKVIVLDNGLIKEYGNPRELLKDKDGIFYSMAKDAGIV